MFSTSGGKVRQIGIQFSFNNEDVVPHSVLVHERPVCVVSEKRAPGIIVFPEQEQCSLKEILQDISKDYVLTDVVYEERPKGGTREATYHMVRFIFSEKGGAKRVADHDGLVNALIELVNDAFWKTRAFSNPWYIDGAEVAEQRSLNIACCARTPVKNSLGQPVLARKRDDKGKKVGDPVPIEPHHILSIKDLTEKKAEEAA